MINERYDKSLKLVNFQLKFQTSRIDRNIIKNKSNQEQNSEKFTMGIRRKLIKLQSRSKRSNIFSNARKSALNFCTKDPIFLENFIAVHFPNLGTKKSYQKFLQTSRNSQAIPSQSPFENNYIQNNIDIYNNNNLKKTFLTKNNEFDNIIPKYSTEKRKNSYPFNLTRSKQLKGEIYLENKLCENNKENPHKNKIHKQYNNTDINSLDSEKNSNKKTNCLIKSIKIKNENNVKNNYEIEKEKEIVNENENENKNENENAIQGERILHNNDFYSIKNNDVCGANTLKNNNNFLERDDNIDKRYEDEFKTKIVTQSINPEKNEPKIFSKENEIQLTSNHIMIQLEKLKGKNFKNSSNRETGIGELDFNQIMKNYESETNIFSSKNINKHKESNFLYKTRNMSKQDLKLSRKTLLNIDFQRLIAKERDEYKELMKNMSTNKLKV